MCIILSQPQGNGPFPEEKLRSLYERNSDGLGIMYAKGDKVRVHKLPHPKDADDIVRFYKKVRGKAGDAPLHVHLRLRTHGDIDHSNTHPYCVLTKETHGLDLWLMHNGVINNIDQTDKKKSDTWHYIRDYMRPALDQFGTELLDAPWFIEMVESHIGGSKFVLLAGDGREWFINRKKGIEHKETGCWVSNDYGLDTRWSKSDYTYGYGTYNSRQSHLPAVQTPSIHREKRKLYPEKSYAIIYQHSHLGWGFWDKGVFHCVTDEKRILGAYDSGVGKSAFISIYYKQELMDAKDETYKFTAGEAQKIREDSMKNQANTKAKDQENVVPFEEDKKRATGTSDRELAIESDTLMGLNYEDLLEYCVDQPDRAVDMLEFMVQEYSQGGSFEFDEHERTMLLDLSTDEPDAMVDLLSIGLTTTGNTLRVEITKTLASNICAA